MERTILSDGVRLVAHDSGGPGAPVMLLHGLAGHSGEWDPTVEWMREQYRVVALDQRGHGASEHRPADVSRAAYVADVVAVIGELGLENPILVGQSLGGHTAMLVAAARPDLVRALVMIEAGPADPSPDIPRDIENWLASWPVPFASRAAAAEFFGGGPAGAGWAAGLEEQKDGWRPRFAPEVMVRSVLELSQRSYRREWHQVRCPTLVVLAESGIFSSGQAREMTRTRPGTVVVNVPGAGHDVHLEKPEMVRIAVMDFLEGAVRGTSPVETGSDS